MPGIQDEALTIEHVQRYESIGKIISGKNVLDAACGEGYGSRILSDYALNVTGLDISEETINNARYNYRNIDNLKFVHGSIAQIPLENNSIDIVVSFDTIEHVTEELQRSFLAEVSRVLKEDGFLIISTPNKEIYSERYNYHNEFHIKEFYEKEFVDFLKGYFKNIRLFYQFFEVASIIGNKADNISNSQFSLNNEYEGEGKYIIALAGNRELKEVNLCSVHVGKEIKFQEYMDRIVSLQDAEAERNNHIQKLDNEIAEKNLYIENLLLEKKENLECIRHLQGEKEKDSECIRHLQGEKEKDSECIRHLQGEKEEISDWIQRLEREKEENLIKINNQRGHIEQLLEAERHYQRILNSKGWKIVSFPGKVFEKLFPVGTRRRIRLSLLMKYMKALNAVNVKFVYGAFKAGGIKQVRKELNEFEHRMSGVMEVPIDTPEILEDEQIADMNQCDRLVFQKHENPVVSIIIPVYNQFSYTYNCLKSILANSGAVPYEIIIADDMSDDLTKRLSEVVENIVIVRNTSNMGFLRNCNNAARHVSGKYILFLNNDTQVQENWLQPLVDLIEKDSMIGMVGSKLIYPDGRLQEAGGIIWKDASAWNYGNCKNPEAPEFNYVKEVDYISGASIMIRTSLWNEIGGFDELYVPAYCEDSDLAFEVRKRGFKVMYQPLSVVVHFEGISNGTDSSTGIKHYQMINMKNFYQKWKDTLVSEHDENGMNVFRARERSQKRKVLLMIDHYVPHFDKDAGSRTLFHYLKIFVSKGYSIKLIGDNFYKHEPYTTIFQQMGIEVLYGVYYAENWENWIKLNGEEIDYIWINRPHISIKYIDILREYTKARIMYYGMDLHFLRIQREYEVSHDKALIKESKEWQEKEFYLMKRSDISYTLSNVEVEVVHKIDSSIPMRIIKTFAYEQFRENVPLNFEERNHIMFVGGFTHTPNEDAMLWFVKEVFPLITSRIDISLYIVGASPTAKIMNLESKNVIIKGFLTDDELQELYDSCRMVVVPLRYGAGVKGKVLEAMYNGLPVITTSIGAEGIEGIEEIVVVEDEKEKFARRVCELYAQPDELEKLSIAGQKYMKDNFSLQAVWDVIQPDFC